MGRLGRVFRFVAAGSLAVGAIAWGTAMWLVHRHGIDPDEWADHEGATVEVDRGGIPTITAEDWQALIEAQGYVVASQRLFQMDLMRRAAGGRLSELFGPAAIDADRKRHLEDWVGAADFTVASFADEDREHCQRYADGVNQFIADHRGRWGLEYTLLSAEPDPWACSDTILIALNMAEELSSTASIEAQNVPWRAALDAEWEQFLFPEDHPWNQPLFGRATRTMAMPSTSLPTTPLAEATANAGVLEPPAPLGGSNSWAWRGPTGTFLANDPHLGAQVPHLWFLLRMRIDGQHWVVGAAIPGVPGVILGMNAHLAWAMTNVGEDVDDYLEETLTADGKRYLARRDAHGEVWADVEERRSTIRVKGGEDVEVVGRHTHRGPLARRKHLGDREFSRQWLPLQRNRGLARLWTVNLGRAQDWEQANAAVDAFTFPAQNLLIVERDGGIGYRASGTGIRRKGHGRDPRSAIEGEWLGFAPPSERRRLWYPPDDSIAFVATANQRIWVDDQGHRWDNDRRAARIREVLARRDDHSHDDMERLQLDTHSRYHQLVLEWVIDHSEPQSAAELAMIDRWRTWDGMAFASGTTFAEALAVERALVEVLIGQVRRHLAPQLEDTPYSSPMRDAWVLVTLETPDGIERFGLDSEPLATHLLTVAAAVERPHIGDNRWRAQHPFVGRIPLIGEWFRVPEFAQWGYGSLIRVERPRFGASLRFVWDLSDPRNSTWITPVGQSGHVGSPHYRDLQAKFHADERLAVFTTDHDWGF